jgi:hypothetical protein
MIIVGSERVVKVRYETRARRLFRSCRENNRACMGKSNVTGMNSLNFSLLMIQSPFSLQAHLVVRFHGNSKAVKRRKGTEGSNDSPPATQSAGIAFSAYHFRKMQEFAAFSSRFASNPDRGEIVHRLKREALRPFSLLVYLVVRFHGKLKKQ